MKKILLSLMALAMLMLPFQAFAGTASQDCTFTANIGSGYSITLGASHVVWTVGMTQGPYTADSPLTVTVTTRLSGPGDSVIGGIRAANMSKGGGFYIEANKVSYTSVAPFVPAGTFVSDAVDLNFLSQSGSGTWTAPMTFILADDGYNAGTYTGTYTFKVTVP